MYLTRAARPEDDLEAIFPETVGHRLNREQVLVVTDETGRLLGASILFHGGHTMAYVGATRIVAEESKQWAARALMRAVTQWCRLQGVRLVGHGAGTAECREAFARLGAKAVREHVLMEVEV